MGQPGPADAGRSRRRAAASPSDASGFVDEVLDGETWRVYYLRSPEGTWLVAAGQKAYERDELVLDLTASQVVPWLLVLPVLLLAMAWAVRHALAPVRSLAAELRRAQRRRPGTGATATCPSELLPLVNAMNGLFLRIEETMARERRFTADAAHELRTPLAVLRAQWDVVRRSANEADRAQAEARSRRGLERMDRLVTQMLSLSRVEARMATTAAAPMVEVDWRPIVEQAMSDCLPLAERRKIELACEWPRGATAPAALAGRRAAADRAVAQPAGQRPALFPRRQRSPCDSRSRSWKSRTRAPRSTPSCVHGWASVSIDRMASRRSAAAWAFRSSSASPNCTAWK